METKRKTRLRFLQSGAMSILSNLALNEPSGAQLNESAPDILSVPEACRLLSVHRNTLYKLIRAGELPAFRLITGGHWRFRRTDLAEWLETRRARSAT
jgi:excisionase family DNA binding protein